MHRAWPLRFYLVLFMMAMTCGIGLVIAWLLYELSTELIAERAVAQARSSAQEAGAELDRLLGPIRSSVQLLALTPGLNGGDYQRRLEALPEMAEALRNSPIAVAVYMGNDQGEYFQLRKLEEAYDLQLFDAPIGARFLLQSVDPRADGGVVHYRFLDGLLRPIGQRIKPSTTDYDPRLRPWYVLAKERGGWCVRRPTAFSKPG